MEYHRSDVRAAAVGRSIDYSSAVEFIAVCFRDTLVSLSVVFEEKCRCFLIFLYSSATVDCKSLVGDKNKRVWGFGLQLSSSCPGQNDLQRPPKEDYFKGLACLPIIPQDNRPSCWTSSWETQHILTYGVFSCRVRSKRLIISSLHEDMQR